MSLELRHDQEQPMHNYQLDRVEVLERMRRAGLYTGSGTTPDQRGWVKERDDHRCQFHEFKKIPQGYEWQQCHRTENRNLAGQELRRARGRQRWQLEVHHIIAQSEMRANPTRHGGEQPNNLITLCAGLAGETGHHDLMSPGMIMAKMMYPTDHTSYDRWLTHIREAEGKGLKMHNTDWDGMLKMVARTRTVEFLRRENKQFPYAKER